MVKMKKILVLGSFGFQDSHCDGQTVKTRNLLDLLNKNEVASDFFDTDSFRHNKMMAFTLLLKLFKCRVLYFLPAQNSLTYLLPIVFIISKITRMDIHYFVVGGWLVEYLEKKTWHRKKLSKIAGIHCETQLMKTQLEDNYGFKNVDVFPNFRISSFIPTNHHKEGKLKLVFMARVVKMKGIDTIFALCEKIRDNKLDNEITIDFYGPYDRDNIDGSIEYFNNNIKKYSFTQYHGVLNPEQINEVLEQYDVMLLPTHYYTEGLPGSILDAYMSGIPVIVTRWKHATEFVDDDKTGFIIPFDDDGAALYDAVMRLFNDTEKLTRFKLSSFEKAYDFSYEKASMLIKTYLYPQNTQKKQSN